MASIVDVLGKQARLKIGPLEVSLSGPAVNELMPALASGSLEVARRCLQAIPDPRTREHVQTLLLASLAGAAAGLAVGAAVGAVAAGPAVGAGLGLVAGGAAIVFATRARERSAARA